MGDRDSGVRRDFFSGGKDDRPMGRKPRRYSRGDRPRDDPSDRLETATRGMASLQILTRAGNREADEGTSSDRDTPTPSLARRSTAPKSRPDSGAHGSYTSTRPREERPSGQDRSSRPVTGGKALTVDKYGVRLIGEHLDFCELISECLSDTNTNYTVIGAIGPQGVGKSTLLSMIGGNHPADMYRQYIFRPSSREAIESSRFQTACIYVYVTKSRMILIDCQAMNSGAILDDAIRLNKTPKLDERLETSKHMELLQAISFMLHVCHSIILCIDWFVDFDLIKTLRTAEMLRANMPKVAVNTSLPNLRTSRKVNLCVVHSRGRATDFCPFNRKLRTKILRAMFADSRVVKICDIEELAYFPTAEIKLRKDPHQSGGPSASGALGDKAIDYGLVGDFESSLPRLRTLLVGAPKDDFTVDGTPLLTEKQWLQMAKYCFCDSTFNQVAAYLAAY